MTWSTAVTDLRNFLSDGPTDRLRWRKRVLGDIDGTNKRFKTFEFRRVTTFVGITAPLGVYVDGTKVNVTVDDLPSGEFTISAPAAGTVVEATYYMQWFIDSELQDFLIHSSNWLLSTDDFTQIPPGLVPAAENYAAFEAYMKMALRWTERLSETYRLEDAPDKDRITIVQYFKELADSRRETALKLRDEYYTRQGMALQPLFRSIPGRVGPVTPRE